MNRLSLQALALTFLVATSGLQAAAPTPSRVAKAIASLKNGAQSAVNFGKDTASNSWNGYKSAGSVIAQGASNAVDHKYKVGAGLVVGAAAVYWLNKNGYLNSAKAKAKNAVKSVATVINNNRKKAAAVAVTGAVVLGLGLNKYIGEKAARGMFGVLSKAEEIEIPRIAAEARQQGLMMAREQQEQLWQANAAAAKDAAAKAAAEEAAAKAAFDNQIAIGVKAAAAAQDAAQSAAAN